MSHNAASSSLPQLRMRRSLDALLALKVPPGYQLRHFEPGDEAAWANLMARNGQLGTWTVETAQPYFAAGSRMPLEGAFFVTAADVPVATAQLHLKPDAENAPVPELGWVAVDPAHSGHGLASVASVAVLRYAASTGHTAIYLLTDDWRLPAVWSYLKLGFEPWMTDPSHPERWQVVHEQLNQFRKPKDLTGRKRE